MNGSVLALAFSSALVWASRSQGSRSERVFYHCGARRPGTPFSLDFAGTGEGRLTGILGAAGRAVYLTDNPEVAKLYCAYADPSYFSTVRVRGKLREGRPWPKTPQEIEDVLAAGYVGVSQRFEQRGLPFGSFTEVAVYDPSALEDVEGSAVRGSLARGQSLRFRRLGPVPPGFTTSPFSFVRGHELELAVDPEEEGRAQPGTGFFHVTTNLPAVLKEGRLRSRLELRQVGRQGAGLGGGFRDEARDKVSMGVTLEAARRVLDGVQMMAKAVHGQLAPAEGLAVLQRLSAGPLMAVEEALGWMLEIPGSREHGLAVQAEVDLRRSFQEVLSAEPGPDLYEAIRRAESVLHGLVFEWQERGWVEMETCDTTIGFTEPASKFLKVKPDQIGILKLALRRGARVDLVPSECELRARPEDVALVGVWQA